MRAEHPGRLLEQLMSMFGITRTQLAAHVGMNYAYLNQILVGEKPVGFELAMLLAQTFSTSEEYWVYSQALYDFQRRKELLKNEGKYRKVRALPLPQQEKSEITQNDRCLCGHFAWDHVNIPDGSCWCGCPIFLKKSGYLAARRRGDVPSAAAPTEKPLPLETDLIDEDPS